MHIKPNENIKNFNTISKNLKMEHKCLKLLAPSNVPFVADGSNPKAKGRIVVSKLERSNAPLKTPNLKVVFLRSQKAKGNREEYNTCEVL